MSANATPTAAELEALAVEYDGYAANHAHALTVLRDDHDGRATLSHSRSAEKYRTIAASLRFHAAALTASEQGMPPDAERGTYANGVDAVDYDTLRTYALARAATNAALTQSIVNLQDALDQKENNAAVADAELAALRQRVDEMTAEQAVEVAATALHDYDCGCGGVAGVGAWTMFAKRAVDALRAASGPTTEVGR